MNVCIALSLNIRGTKEKDVIPRAGTTCSPQLGAPGDKTLVVMCQNPRMTPSIFACGIGINSSVSCILV